MDDGLEGAPPSTSPSSATGIAAGPDPVPGARDGRTAEAAGPTSASDRTVRSGRTTSPRDATPSDGATPDDAAPPDDAASSDAGPSDDATPSDATPGSAPDDGRSDLDQPTAVTRAVAAPADARETDAPAEAAPPEGTPGDRTPPADGTVRLPVASGPARPARDGARARSRLDGPTTHLPGVRGGARPDTSEAGSPTAVTPVARSAPPSRPPAGRPGGRRGAPERRGSRFFRGGGPLPGTMIVDRYRLVAEVGRDERAGAALWKGRDVMLERDVAVTLLTGGWQADARASSALSRATRSAHFEHANAARVLDVVAPGSGRLPTGILGAAVAEWTPGRDLVELVSGGPLRPSEALRVVEPLADAVAEAHRSGLVLGLGDPRRVRVGARASARLAFPMPPGDATVDDDVHGLGATLYLLLTARWPAADGRAPAGLRAAPRTAEGAATPVRQLRPDLPLDLAALVDRTLDADGGIRTAAAVHRLAAGLRESSEDDGVLLPVTEDGASIGEDPSAVWHDDDDSEPSRDPATRRKLRIGLTLLVVATLAIVAFVAFQLVSLVSGGGSSAPPLVIPASPTAAAPPAAGVAAAPAPAPAPTPPPGAPVQLASVAVYDPSGGPDNPTRVNRAVDGDPATVWSTNSYRQQLPALKPGIGVMATFTAPSGVAAVTVRSPSPGTRVEIRSAPAADVPLSRTQVLGAGVVVGDSVTIPLQAAPPTGNLLVWITALGQDGGQFSTALAEVTVARAG